MSRQRVVVRWAHLCDRYQVNPETLHFTLHEIFSLMSVARFPFVRDRPTDLVIGLLGPPNADVRIEVALEYPSGLRENLIESRQVFPAYGTVIYCARFQTLRFDEPGNHCFVVTCDDDVLVRASFGVLEGVAGAFVLP